MKATHMSFDEIMKYGPLGGVDGLDIDTAAIINEKLSEKIEQKSIHAATEALEEIRGFIGDKLEGL